MENYKFTLTNKISKKLSHQIISIRREHNYSSNYDENYWNGGIYNLLDESIIYENQLNNLNSYYLLVYNSKNELKAYSRFSVNEKIFSKIKISKLHVVCSSKELINQYITIENKKEKIGKFILEKVIEFCIQNKSDLLISEIAIFPYPNLPSLILHKKLNFISICDSMKNIENDFGQFTSFLILGKKLSNINFDFIPLNILD